jgi:hypothetical protein
VLAAAAAVPAIVAGAIAYDTAPSPHKQPPSRVVVGDVPGPYVGTWKTVITTNDDKNTRTLVIKQGRIGDRVLTLTADGPTHHCVFQAQLVSVTLTSIHLGNSAVTTAGPAHTATAASPTTTCTSGSPTTVTLLNDGRLQRTNDDNTETLTYTRAG